MKVSFKLTQEQHNRAVVHQEKIRTAYALYLEKYPEGRDELVNNSYISNDEIYFFLSRNTNADHDKKF